MFNLLSAQFDKFPWTPLMFWQDITYLFKKIGELFEKLFNKSKKPDAPSEGE